MKTGRNEPCPCGSGKKFKQCHEAAKAAENQSKGTVAMVIVGAALALGIGAFAWGMVEDTGVEDRTWSEEHGHWHGADGRELGAAGLAPGATTPVPQPPGEPPPGKVWSSEHGHWHDA